MSAHAQPSRSQTQTTRIDYGNETQRHDAVTVVNLVIGQPSHDWYEFSAGCFDFGVSGMAGWIVLSLLGLLYVCGVSGDADYYIGAGRYDITGPAAEVEMVRETFTRR